MKRDRPQVILLTKADGNPNTFLQYGRHLFKYSPNSLKPMYGELSVLAHGDVFLRIRKVSCLEDAVEVILKEYSSDMIVELHPLN